MGALTIKPYAFQYRPWEMERVLIPNLISAFPETLSVQFKNKKVLRVLNPTTFIGLTNRVRFSEKFLQNLFFHQDLPLDKDIDFAFFFNCAAALNLSYSKVYCTDYFFKYGVIGFFLLYLNFKRVFLVDYKVTSRAKFYSNIVELVESFARQFLLTKGFLNFKTVKQFVPISKTFEFVATQTQLSNINIFTILDLRVYFIDFLLQLKKQSLKQTQVSAYSTNIFYATKVKHNLYSKSSSIFESQLSILPFVNKGFFSQIFLRSFLLEPSTYFFGDCGSLIVKNINLQTPILQTLTWFGFSEQVQPDNLNVVKIYVQGFFLLHSNHFFLNSFARCISVLWLKN